MRIVYLLMLTLTFTACGGGGHPADAGTNGPDPQALAAMAEVKTGYGAPLTAVGWGQESASLCLAGVYVANTQGAQGGTVTTGTLTQATEGSLDFSYASTPVDRMHFVFANDTQMDCYFQRLDGTFQGDDAESFVNGFLSNDHKLTYRVVADGRVDLAVVSDSASGSVHKTAKGTFVREGITYNADLTYDGTESWDPKAFHLVSDELLAGDVSADGFSANIKESRMYESIYGDNLAEQSDRSFDNSWTTNGAEYRITDGRIRTVFVDTKPSQLDAWIATGTVFRNGTAIGSVQLEKDETTVRIFVDTPDGRVVLEEYGL